LNDLQKSDFDYEFNEEKANRAISICKILRHTKGEFRGIPFDVQPFQGFILAMFFGWVYKNSGYRRFMKGYLEMARKGGKSEFAAAIEIIMTFFDGEGKPETYTAATKSDQAEYVYSAAVAMCKMLANESPVFAERVRVMQYVIKELVTDGFITKMTSDSKTEDGASPHCAVVDEYHAHKDDSIVKVIETGMGARRQPLLLIITTAGFDKFSSCKQFRDVLVQILEGTIINENLFGCIWTLDEEEEMHDPKKWIKSNPAIGKTPRFDRFQAQYQTAITEGATALVEFKTKNCNIWVDSASVWITSDQWDDCKKILFIKELQGKRCFVGMDLSSRNDLSAITYYFPDEKYFFTKFYCPETKIKLGRRADGVDYLDFMSFGSLVVTPGITIDYDYILKDLFDYATQFNIELVGYDPFNADLIVPKIEDVGLNVGAVRQGFLTLSPATKRLEELILNKKIYHSGCPIMSWNMSNVELETDAAGNIKPSKAKSKNKIDGVAALVTALAAYMHTEINLEGEITLEQIKKMLG
jgi:phage terminase large subunit-like protein